MYMCGMSHFFWTNVTVMGVHVLVTLGLIKLKGRYATSSTQVQRGGTHNVKTLLEQSPMSASHAK